MIRSTTSRSTSWPLRQPVARRLAALALACAVAAGAAGCRRTPPADERAAPARGGELVASLRSEPEHYNRYFSPRAATEIVALLTHARLVHIDRVEDTVEPALAESWDESPDGTGITFRLRRGVHFSDGHPFTADDVVFSFAVAYEAPGSVIGPGLMVAGKRLEASAPDPHTVVVRFPAPFAPGARILEGLPILPRHRLETAFRDKTIDKAWTPGRPLSELAGLGPFVLAEHVAGQRLVFTRNPHYWKTAEDGTPLPLLDRLRVEIVPDQNAEALRMEAGDTDLMANGNIRPDDHARFRRLAGQGRLRLVDGGVGLDPDLLWFNLTPQADKDRRPWLRRKEFRQALSYAADRQAIADTVYLGAAVPIHGPVTPRNETWYSAGVPAYPYDPARARQLLDGIGLADRNGDGMLEDASGASVRFSVLVQQAVTTRERAVAMLQDHFRRVGVGLDVVPVDVPGLQAAVGSRKYDSAFHGFQASATDPAMQLDFWLSSGGMHIWNPAQPSPATEWEKRIDTLMAEQVTTLDLEARQRIFTEVQRVFGEALPAIYFVAPRVTLALSPRVANARPAPQIPEILWSADTLAVAPDAGGR